MRKRSEIQALTGRRGNASPPRKLLRLKGFEAFNLSKLLGIRSAALIEILIFFVVILAVDLFFFDGTRFRNLEPHPFWVIVLLAAVQYGTNEGILAAVASSLALLVGNLPRQTIDQDFYSYLHEIGLNPLLWAVTAVIIGELRMRYANRERKLTKSLSESEERESTITAAYQDLMTAHEKLELSVTSDLNSVASLYRAVKQLQTLSPDRVMAGAGDIIERISKAKKFSIYLLVEDRLELVSNRGWSQEDRYASVIGSDHPMFHEIVGRQRLLTIAEATDEPLLQGQGLLAGPVHDADTGETLGMLKIESLAFADLNFSAIENFRVLCELLGTTLANARRFETMASESMVAGSSLLLSDAFFSRQTAFLASLARRMNFPVSTMRITIANPEKLSKSQLAKIPAIIRDCTVHVLRSTDMAFEFQSDQWQYIIVLPNTPLEDTKTVERKFRSALAGTVRGTNMQFEITSEPLVEAGEGEEAPPSTSSGMEDYARQTQFLIALSRRAGFPVCGIRITVTPKVSLPDEVMDELGEAVANVIRDALNDTEIAFNLDATGQVSAILLPGVDIKHAKTRAVQFRDVILNRLGQASSAISVECRLRELVRPRKIQRPAAPQQPELDARRSPCQPLAPSTDHQNARQHPSPEPLPANQKRAS